MDFKVSSHGKLLITAEYYVLKGAKSFAIPTKFKQDLEFKYNASNKLKWISLDSHNQVWIEALFDLNNISIISDKNKHSLNLQKILRSARNINSEFLQKNQGGEVTTSLNFETNWGLGTSSTLINNIALWAKIDPYELLWNNFKASGYDIACANSEKPLIYKLINNKPNVKQVKFNPNFKDHLFFVYLNKKQDSNVEVDTFSNLKIDESLVRKISELTTRFINAKNLEDFQKCISEHELIISKTIGKELIQKKYFNDYNGKIKSLGAWGGDFILAAGPLNSKDYFSKKGFSTIFNYKEIF